MRLFKFQKAFTLLELMIAMLLFAILSTLAYAGLQNIILTRDHVEVQEKYLTELQTAFLIIGRDIEQSIGRTVRNEYGEKRPALESSAIGNLLTLTRAGYTNFSHVARSNLQRVAYVLNDDKQLKRVTWQMLDQDFSQEAIERVLLENVEKVNVTFFRVSDLGQAEETDQWPADFEADPSQLPLAVQFEIETEKFGSVRRVYRISPGENIVKPREKESEDKFKKQSESADKGKTQRPVDQSGNTQSDNTQSDNTQNNQPEGNEQPNDQQGGQDQNNTQDSAPQDQEGDPQNQENGENEPQ